MKIGLSLSVITVPVKGYNQGQIQLHEFSTAMTNPESLIPDPVIKAITSMARSAAPIVINQVQRNETVVRILRELKLDPVQPPKDVDSVYIYTFVNYCIGKPEPILKLFRKKEVKKSFWNAYTSNRVWIFFDYIENLISKENSLGNEIRKSKINLHLELESFGKIFIEIAKLTKSEDFQPYPDWNLDEYPKEFKPLIQEKTRIFCGRHFVFKAFNSFLGKETKGYFTIVGDAGMGKSAIAAKYVATRKSPCYFNVRAEGNNKPERFIESISQQLIKRYQLQNTHKDNLVTLLQKVSEILPKGKRLVIVVDALDEVDQKSREHNLLYLPKELPEQIYFLLTRRPYTLENKQLIVSPDVPMKELDLRNIQYEKLNREDIQNYMRLVLNKDSDYKDALWQWIQERQINEDEFIQQVANKSENNFMYLRYVLPAIARRFYDDLSLQELPEGLQAYYQDHWRRMEMDQTSQKEKVIILFILVQSKTPPTCEMIAKIAKQDECDVEKVLNEWVEYLRKQENHGEICYSIYHTSFLEFLKGKKKLKVGNKLFQEVNQRIFEYMEKEMA